MAYTFSNTQGDRTITVNDNQLDQTSYSLTLLGKNVTNYGERIAENTIRQLENFASPNQPNPTVKLVGQLWYDKTGEHLRVYRGDNADKGFTELAYRPKLSATSPTGNIQNGEMYYDTTTGDLNLKIYNGSAWVNVIGTEYIQDLTAAQLVTNGTHTNITASYDDSGDAAIDLVISDSTIRSKFTGGTGVTYNNSTGDIAIGQAVETTSNVTFNNVNASGAVVITGDLTVNGTTTTINSTTVTVDDAFFRVNSDGADVDAGFEANVGGVVKQITYDTSANEWTFGSEPVHTTGGFEGNLTGDVVGDVTGTVSSIANHSTTNLTEGTNLYHTTARARAAISENSAQLAYNSTTGVLTYTQGDTDTVAEGSTNLYYTNARADARVQAAIDTDTSFGSASNTLVPSQLAVKTYVDAQVDTKDHLSELGGNTDDLTEGTTNKFFTNTLARAAISAQAPLSYDSSTGILTLTEVGDISSVGAGNGLTGGGTSGAVTLNVGAGSYITVNANDIAVDATTAATASKVVARDGSGDIFANIINGTATAARYADLAEKYIADADYEVGTVLIFGGSAEVTTTTKQNNPSIAGVVSENPAYLMNSELEGDHVTAVALKGRVPVKVVGPIRKGDVLIHSHTEGHAQAAPFGGYHVTGPCCIGIAITEKADAGAGVVEALVK